MKGFIIGALLALIIMSFLNTQKISKLEIELHTTNSTIKHNRNESIAIKFINLKKTRLT